MYALYRRRLAESSSLDHSQGTLAWDALHFLRIAQCGYETEKSHAFFPLLPALMRGVQATRERPAAPLRPPPHAAVASVSFAPAAPVAALHAGAGRLLCVQRLLRAGRSGAVLVRRFVASARPLSRLLG